MERKGILIVMEMWQTASITIRRVANQVAGQAVQELALVAIQDQVPDIVLMF